MEWIEESQIEQNGSMEPAGDKLRKEDKKFASAYPELIIRDEDKYARVYKDTPVPQYYELATYNQQPMTAGVSAQ